MFVGDVRCAITATWMFLKVVRRQPVIFGPDECLEEPPGLGGQVVQEFRLIVLRALTACRAAGRLIHHAKSGETTQRTSQGAAGASASGLENPSPNASTAASAGANAISRTTWTSPSAPSSALPRSRSSIPEGGCASDSCARPSAPRHPGSSRPRTAGRSASARSAQVSSDRVRSCAEMPAHRQVSRPANEGSHRSQERRGQADTGHDESPEPRRV